MLRLSTGLFQYKLPFKIKIFPRHYKNTDYINQNMLGVFNEEQNTKLPIKVLLINVQFCYNVPIKVLLINVQFCYNVPIMKSSCHKDNSIKFVIFMVPHSSYFWIHIVLYMIMNTCEMHHTCQCQTYTHVYVHFRLQYSYMYM